MIWTICVIISILMVALGVKFYLDKKRGSLRFVFILACFFIATYIIYIPPYLETFDSVLSALIGNVIRVLQVITIDADVMDFYDVIKQGIGNPLFVKFIMLLLGFLHVAMPSVSAMTAVTVLLRYFSSVQLFFAKRGKKPLFVFSEVNERSLQLAKSLREIKCDIVFANSSKDSLNNESDGNYGFIFKEEDIAEINVSNKKGKDTYFFCLSEDEDLSLSQSLQLIEKCSEFNENQENIHIYQFSKYQDFSVYIDSSNKGNLDVQCVNEYEVLIYNLLDRYPLFKYAESEIHVLLHGLSQINIVALKAIAWCGQLNGYSIKISVVGIDINEKFEELKLSVPGLFTNRYNITFYDCNSEKEIVDCIKNNCFDANYIMVSEDIDNDTMNRAILLRRLFYKLSDDYSRCPPIFCYIKEPSKFNILKNLTTAESNPSRKMEYGLTPFGSLDEIYSYKILVDSDIEKLAKNVHLAYEEIFSVGEINVNEALKRYNIFEVNKRSNRANALHIRYKLNLLGLDYTDSIEGEDVILSDYYSEESLEKLSISEHDRWVAFLETEGWELSTKEDVYAYRESGISKGRHNCPILKMHPYLCEYEKLKELSLDLEGKDTTVYDKELILRIPDILGDKWNVVGKKYKITKI